MSSDSKSAKLQQLISTAENAADKATDERTKKNIRSGVEFFQKCLAASLNLPSAVLNGSSK